jgi:hypothetical protein
MLQEREGRPLEPFREGAADQKHVTQQKAISLAGTAPKQLLFVGHKAAMRDFV